MFRFFYESINLNSEASQLTFGEYGVKYEEKVFKRLYYLTFKDQRGPLFGEKTLNTGQFSNSNAPLSLSANSFQTETCSGGINISILAACLSDKLSGQTNGLQGGPQTPIQDRSSSEDLPQSHNPLPLCKYSFIVQYCSNIPQPLPFIEQEKDVLILIMMQIIIVMM